MKGFTGLFGIAFYCYIYQFIYAVHFRNLVYKLVQFIHSVDIINPISKLVRTNLKLLTRNIVFDIFAYIIFHRRYKRLKVV